MFGFEEAVGNPRHQATIDDVIPLVVQRSCGTGVIPMTILAYDLYNRIKSLCKDGDALVESNDSLGGLRKYHRAWRLLPEPKEKWEAATWILSAIGDAHFGSGDYQHAISALTNALSCPDGLGNPFIHLRLGESYLELGDTLKAQDELARAYMGSGNGIFEHENPKYLAFLQSVLKPSPGKDLL
jgi:tetratricopeptide (TPR) repeat protein